ncbi:PREDICTED: josephin-like protein [Tarenaya hassleriana]|uniref:josephin-like protein n=1 Tax=Tarenaya hassleriana TaxID=28532 RepID=UPI00053C4CE2|nr:PREDICTED: josephin-like protein [Tarenaya hassleriana]
MSRKSCKRVSFSPDPEATEEPIFPKHGEFSCQRQGRRRVVVGFLSFGLRRSPARRMLRRLGARVVKTLRFISSGKGKTTSSFSSRKVSSASSSAHLTRSKSLAESESHRAEAIEDCIEFLNSSSSLSRSNSVSTCSC